MQEIFLVQITGKEDKALAADFFDLLSQHGVTVLDIGQSVIHNALNLGVLVELNHGDATLALDQALASLARDKGVDIQFAPVTRSDYEQWVQRQCNNRYIVTLLAKQISAGHLARISEILCQAGLEIFDVRRLTERPNLNYNQENSKACIEFAVRGPQDDGNIDSIRARFLETANDLGVDIAFQRDNAFRRNRRLVVFDMDSTLIETEVIDELARHAGVADKVCAITEKAMAGEIDFKESFTRRVALLKDLPATTLATVAESLPLMDGAEQLICVLKKLGYKTAIISGGFDYFGRKLQAQLGIDYVFANELEIENGKVTGRVVGQVVDAERKASLLKQIAEKENISLQQVIAVGDGANDLQMLSIAGLGIAFHAKPIVKENAEQAISTVGLDGILYLIGVRDLDQLDLIGAPQ